jgi:hypothetical protein
VDSETLGTDGQYVLVTDIYNQFTGVTDPYDPDSGRLLQTLLWMRSNEQQWGLYEFNLSKFASATKMCGSRSRPVLITTATAA